MNEIHRPARCAVAAAVLSLVAAHAVAQTGATPSDSGSSTYQGSGSSAGGQFDGAVRNNPDPSLQRPPSSVTNQGSGTYESVGTPGNQAAPAGMSGTGTGTSTGAGMGASSTGTGADTGTSGQMNQDTGSAMGATSGDGAASRYSTDLSTLPNEPTAAGPGAGYGSGYSWLPYTTSGYVGLSIGAADIDSSCAPGTQCDDPDGAIHIFTGGMFNPNFGLQLGYFRLNDADRNGGKTKISGVNLVLTGIAPLTNTFSLVGRVGGTYGWTDVSAAPGVVTATGDETGFGAAYGVGVAWDFNRNWSVTLHWDRHHLKFPGDDKKNTDIATIGFKYRF